MDIPDILKDRYTWMKRHSAHQESGGFAMEVLASDRIGLIADITSHVSAAGGSLLYVQSWIEHDRSVHIMIQVDRGELADELEKKISAVPSVLRVVHRPTFGQTYGKRIIVLGGGAQVAQVAAGAIAEADRHNIRGETISVDTIAVIGENELADAVRAVGRLHRAGILVLAGALMGGEITIAVKELREQYGIPVIALRMAGSVNKVVDLVVTDPVEAGVMAVMLISHVGKFNLLRAHGQSF
jgi:energy-converting hydrogenase B subunit Q